MSEYNPQQEIDRICETHKIVFIDVQEFEKVRIAGLLPLLHNTLLKFIEKLPPRNCFEILTLKDPSCKFEFAIKINYSGSPVLEDGKNQEEIDIFDLDKRGNLKETKDINVVINLEENKKVMSRFIFDESKVLKNVIFPQLKLDNETFAYGLMLPKEKSILDKIGNIVGTEQIWSPALLTSDKRLIEGLK